VDRSDSRNNGVESDHLVSTSVGVPLRLIIYKNPKGGKAYSYLTNDNTPGIALQAPLGRGESVRCIEKMEERKS